MTIGIVATGTNIAPDVVSVLAGMEQLAQGALGGFVTMVVRTHDGEMHYFETQNGGVSALSVEVSPLKESCSIGLISSGPFRPKPLSRFLAWDEQGNIVSGHRFPQLHSRSGLPANQELLSLVQRHGATSDVLDAMLADNARLDAGFVALDARGQLYQGNTRRVAARGDIGHCQGRNADRAIAVTLNSISFPQLVCEFLLRRVLQPEYPSILMDKSVTIRLGSRDKICIDRQQKVTSLQLSDHSVLSAHYEGALICSGTPVYQEGQWVGVTEDEPYVVCHEGRIIFLNGQACASLRIRHKLD